MTRTVAIVAAAGRGRRLGRKARKPFVLLRGRPLVSYALEALEASGRIDAVVIAAERSCVRRVERLVRRFKFRKVIRVVAGGATRFESVRNCLAAVGESFDIVLIQDAARPFLTDALISSSARAAEKHGACVVAVPESDTVKYAGGGAFVQKTLDRKRVFRAQTPQAFRRRLIQKAYRRRAGVGATDDSFLVERMGAPVAIVEGSYRNIKVTTREDLKLAELFIRRR